MRLFIALNFKPSGQTELVKLIDTLQKEGVSGRAIPQENLHVTIAFLGECDPDQIPVIEEILQDIPLPALRLKPSGYDRFLSALVLRFEKDPALMDYQAQVVKALKKADLPFDDRPYGPHVTLIRVPRSRQKGDLSKARAEFHDRFGSTLFRLEPMEIESCSLFSSTHSEQSHSMHYASLFTIDPDEYSQNN